MLGFHVNKEWDKSPAPTLRAHVETARRFRDKTTGAAAGAPFAFQVFIAGPCSLKFVASDAELDDLRDLMAGGGLWGVAHGTFMDNPWNTAAPRHKYHCHFIRQELERARRAGLAGVVVHLMSHPPAVVAAVMPRLRVRGARVFLETPHLKPEKAHYETPEKLAALFRLIRAGGDPDLAHTGLCIDTAHIWAGGADISSYAAGRDWVDRLVAVHDTIPPRAIIIHLNDNRHPCGAGRDEHDPLLRGAIWGEYRHMPGKSGLAAFVEYILEYDVPAVLERKARKAADGEPGMSDEEAIAADYQALAELGAR